MPSRRALCFGLFAIAAAALSSVPLLAQVGEQPVRIIFPYAAGGSGDALSRLIADKLQDGLHRPVIVEDRTGAAGRIGVMDVKNAAPDGSTLLLTPIATMSIYPNVYAKLDYDPIKDFAAISQLGTFDLGIAVGPQVPAKTLQELITWAEANSKEANFATPGAGSLPHFLGILLGRKAGIDLRAVPYRGSAAGLADVAAGHIAMIVTTTSDLVQMHKAGRIRILATSDKARSPFLPDVPTFREVGYDIVGTGWYGMLAPAKTPPDVIDKLNKLIVAAVRSPDIKDKMLAFGLVPTGTSAAEFAAIVKADKEFWGPPIKASGFTPTD